MTFQPRPLPPAACQLCERLNAPDRLVAQLAVVHDAAVEIIQGIAECFPSLDFESDAVLYGAATHDMGKVLHPEEPTGASNQHEIDGPVLLAQHGVPSHLARFSRTHGAWSREELTLEDPLVAVADPIWKGQRLESLETQLIERIAKQTTAEQWQVFDELDGLLEQIARRGDERLAWQSK